MGQDTSLRLGTAPIGKLVFSLALPAVAGQVINMLYNIVDRIYIGHIPVEGDLALTGVGITFPILMAISAFSAFAGAGGAPIASARLGAGDQRGAEKILGNSTLLLLIISAVLTTTIALFQEPLLYAFGASEDTIQYGLDYLGIYLIGTVFVQLTVGLNVYISAQGKALTAMMSVLLGAVTNIILDPIFIFVFDWGVKGAAIATVLSQGVSACWVLSFLLSKRAKLRIRKSCLRLERTTVLAIGALGIAPFIMQITECLVTVVFNRGMQEYGGDLYVGSITILTSLMQLLVMPINGFTSGAQPILSYNYGAGKPERVKQAIKVVLAVALTTSLVVSSLFMLFPRVFAGIFTPNAELLELTAKMIPVFFFGMLFFGLQMTWQMSFLSLGQAKISLFVALLRKVILLVPLAILLPFRFGVQGIYWAEPIADSLSVIISTTFFVTNIRRILKSTPTMLQSGEEG